MAESLLADLTQLVEKSKGQRNRFESDWYLNVAFYLGEQWVFWNRGRLYEPQLEGWRVVTFTDNRIIGIVRTEVSKMTKPAPDASSSPRHGTRPTSTRDARRAMILNHLWKSQDLERKQRSALKWSRITGAGFWKVYWDSSCGTSLRTSSTALTASPSPILRRGARCAGTPTPEAVYQQLGATKKTIAQGDICVEVRSPFEVLVDPLAGEDGLSGAEWVIEETVQSMDYCRRRWPKHEFKEDADAISGLAESRLNPGFSSDTAASTRACASASSGTSPAPSTPRASTPSGPTTPSGRRRHALHAAALRDVHGRPGAGALLADQHRRAAARPSGRVQQDPQPDPRERLAHRQPGAAQEPPGQRRVHGRPGRGSSSTTTRCPTRCRPTSSRRQMPATSRTRLR
jgi:hypothetical protein